MIVEEVVANKELCQELNKLGVNKDSLFIYYGDEIICLKTMPPCCLIYEIISAFTSDELIDMIPAFLDTRQDHPFNGFRLKITKSIAKNIQYMVNYECDRMEPGDMIPRKLFQHNLYDETLANVLAKTLITVLKSDLLHKETLS